MSSADPVVTGPFAIYRRGGDVAIVHRFSLQKLYLTADAWDADPDRALARLRAHDLVRPPSQLEVLQSVVTGACNFRCQYCSVLYNPQPPSADAMDAAVVDRVVALWSEHFGDRGCLHIITGGEPLLNWPAVQRLVRGVRTQTVMFTNGSLLDGERARWLANHGVNVLISLDGPGAVHDRLRRDTRDQDTAQSSLRGYREARAAGCVTGISMVVGVHNAGHLVEVVEQVLDELQPASLGVNLPHHSTRYPRCTLDLEQYAADMVELFHVARRRGLYLYPLTKFVRPLLTERFKWFDCSGVGEKMVVFPDGGLSNCINCIPAVAGPRPLQRWREEVPMNVRSCRDCAAVGICGGGCLFDGQGFAASENGFDPRHCRVSQVLMRAVTWDIFDRCGYGSPTVEQMATPYRCFLSQGGERSLSISVGHETGDV